MNRPTPNPKIAALIATKNIENIKLAFELANAANCPYLKAFKKKYFGKKFNCTGNQLMEKLKSLFFHITKLRFSIIDWDDFNLLDSILQHGACYTAIRFKIDRKTLEERNRFFTPLNKRITASKTIKQWALLQLKMQTKRAIKQKYYNKADVPF